MLVEILPKDEPFTGEWQDALAFQYHYNALPSSIISRFIVRMNGFIHKTVWRSGVVLKRDENTALIKADIEDRKVYIWVNGPEHTRRDFLAAICAEFATIHKTIIKIEATPKVPHPDYPELILDYAELNQFERDGIPEFPRWVDGKTVIVNVRQLLNGVRTGDDPVPSVERNLPRAAQPVQLEASVPAPAPVSLPFVPLKVARAVFVDFPKAIGRIPLDLAGKGKDAGEFTKMALGYGGIILILLLWRGVVNFASLLAWSQDTWRFFFPVK